MDKFEIFLIPFLTFRVFLWPHAIAFFCFKSRIRANKRNVNTIQRKLTKNSSISRSGVISASDHDHLDSISQMVHARFVKTSVTSPTGALVA